MGTETPRASVDSVQLKVAAILYAAARYAYGGPAHQRPGRNGDPLITHCTRCGTNADQVSVDLVEYPQPGMVRAEPVLFVDERQAA